MPVGIFDSLVQSALIGSAWILCGCGLLNSVGIRWHVPAATSRMIVREDDAVVALLSLLARKHVIHF